MFNSERKKGIQTEGEHRAKSWSQPMLEAAILATITLPSSRWDSLDRRDAEPSTDTREEETPASTAEGDPSTPAVAPDSATANRLESCQAQRTRQ